MKRKKWKIGRRKGQRHKTQRTEAISLNKIGKINSAKMRQVWEMEGRRNGWEGGQALP